MLVFRPGIVLDPFAGIGTTCMEAWYQDKDFIGIEPNPKYAEIGNKKVNKKKMDPFFEMRCIMSPGRTCLHGPVIQTKGICHLKAT